MVRSLDDIDGGGRAALELQILERKEIPDWKNEGRDQNVIDFFEVSDIKGNIIEIQVWDYSPLGEEGLEVGSWYYLDKVRIDDYESGVQLNTTKSTNKTEIQEPKIDDDRDYEIRFANPPVAGMALLDHDIAQIKSLSDPQCGFFFNKNDWEDQHDGRFNPHGGAPESPVWRCPHECMEGRNTCPIHTPPSERDQEDTRAFIKEILTDSDRPNELIGGELPALEFIYDTLSGDVVDLRAARVDGNLLLRNLHLDSPVFLIGTVVDGEVDLKGSHFRGDFVARNLHVTDVFSAAFTVFSSRPRFKYGMIESKFDLYDSTLSGLSMPDAEIGGELDLREVELTKGLNISRGDCYGGLNISKSTISDSIRCDGATIWEAVDMSDGEFRGEIDMSTVEWEAVISFDCSYAAFGDEVNFDGIQVKLFQCKKANFSREFECCDIEVADKAIFDATVFEDTAMFRGAEFSGLTTFENTIFQRQIAFDELVSGADPIRFDDARFESKVSFDAAELAGPVSFQAIHSAELVAFIPSELQGPVDCTEAVFNGGFNCDPTVESTTDDTCIAISMVRAKITKGELCQPTAGCIEYDLTEATLGEVQLKGEHDSSAAFLDRYKIVQTRFEGFRFEDHYCFEAADWEIVGSLTEGEPKTGTERATYLKAKNGAEAVGAVEAQRNFFIKERRAQRRLYNKLSGARLANWVLDKTCEYGENYFRVLITSLLMIGVFSFALPTVEYITRSLEGDSVTVMTLLSGNIFESAPYDSWLGYILISFESFTTMVFGGVSVTNPGVRLVAAFEGFIGAFLIALFLFTITRSVSR